jgi:transposase InsO family protein
MKQIYVTLGTVKGYIHLMQYLDDVTGNPQKETIEKRVEIIKFFDDYGGKATRIAFGKSRSTVYLWKQKIKKANGKLSSLAPLSKTPKNKRRRIVDPDIERFIVEYRSLRPGADKVTIKPALRDFCLANNLRPISESTIGRIISDLKTKGRLPRSSKISLNGRYGTLVVRDPKLRKKLRRKSFNPKLPGDLVQMDTVSIFTAGLKRYIFTAIDVKTRFAFAYTYKSASSANGRDFLGKFLKVVPFVVDRVQTDNGSEFAKYFDASCGNYHLTHFFNYPRHPKSNAYCERFNRTVQEQCVNLNMDRLDETEDFNRELMQYLIWYNTEKPHRGIGKIPPMRYYLNSFLSNPVQSNMLWTLTFA